MQWKSGWLWTKRYEGTDKCLFFFDPHTQTFVNVEENNKSVFIQVKKSRWRGSKISLHLKDTAKYANQNKYPYIYAGPTGRQLQITSKTANGKARRENIICYKFLNTYRFRSENYVAKYGKKVKN